MKAPEHGEQLSEPYEVTVGRKLRELHPNVKAGTAFYYIKHIAVRPSGGGFIAAYILLGLGVLLIVLTVIVR